MAAELKFNVDPWDAAAAMVEVWRAAENTAIFPESVRREMAVMLDDYRENINSTEWLTVSISRGVLEVAPAPRLAALLANIRAQPGAAPPLLVL
jgi:hypothetical protein